MSRTALGWLLVTMQVIVLVVLLLLPWRAPSLVGLVAGGAVCVAGVVLLLASFRRLGNALTATPVPIAGAGLRTSGPYRFVRHPIYSAVLLLTLGFLIAFGSAWSWIWGLAAVGFFWAKSRWEDRLLSAEYGQEWARWSATTGALLPRLRRSSR
jgi:protein-S-isoprenylcysteine O-methyltransferase Ste14